MQCRICNSKDLFKVFNLGKQPLANKYPKNLKEIKKEKKYNLTVYFCKSCKSAQIKNIISRDIMFKEYFYLSSVNKGLKLHFEKLAKKLKNFNFVIDIGSNDGILLDPLKKNKVKAIGIDPSINVGKMANDRGLLTYIGFFDQKIIKRILKKHPKPDAIVASSVITHLEKPIDFARNIKSILDEDGTLIIEIEYLYNFLKSLEYERFYFDRPFYYSASSLSVLFKKFGMTMYDIEEINIHGSSLRIYIKNKKIHTMTNRCKKILEKEKKYLTLSNLKRINYKIENETKIFKNKLIKLKKENKFVIGYGAPARVSTITNFASVDSNLINYIIDDSPIKQNKFTPGSHIKILPKSRNINSQINTVIVFAYEYFNDIKKNFKKHKINFYKPIPFKKIK